MRYAVRSRPRGALACALFLRARRKRPTARERCWGNRGLKKRRPRGSDRTEVLCRFAVRETLVCAHLLSAGLLCDRPHPACELRPDFSGARVSSFNRLVLPLCSRCHATPAAIFEQCMISVSPRTMVSVAPGKTASTRLSSARASGTVRYVARSRSLKCAV